MVNTTLAFPSPFMGLAEIQPALAGINTSQEVLDVTAKVAEAPPFGRLKRFLSSSRDDTSWTILTYFLSSLLTIFRVTLLSSSPILSFATILTVPFPLPLEGLIVHQVEATEAVQLPLAVISIVASAPELESKTVVEDNSSWAGGSFSQEKSSESEIRKIGIKRIYLFIIYDFYVISCCRN
ncbi:hypothetical protein SDC9_153021 [bioreactor metagenome]|uniref:Uncharacterized protein n=1 Tax=bioreactor metagenome TaxID=1076179 RepID=A0A645EUR1_9ZZZZ